MGREKRRAPSAAEKQEAGAAAPGAAARKLRLPLSKEDALSLHVGEMVLLSGQMVTGRDRVHKFLVREMPDKKDIPFALEGGVLYHCGPLLTKEDDTYRLIAAGPTTSMRVEMYEAEVIRRYGIRGVVGKGGMGEETRSALQEAGAVYFNAVSGAAVYLADRIKRVVGGWMVEEFGAPEAMWLLEVEDFPAVVTMDAHGNSLHRTIEEASRKNLRKLIRG
ncbi:MAG: FumA C-terminus/TtdB family hydratase beta subunit [Alphaproteobacteria bacterium]|uniref:FumA C-terminus/TtdB family hydratase beta subunit n=1 Tax=Candidatus Nitrobium versatile TaxID=2884831 RepID=A0A953JBY4_9BACT|nr:FumA C-terminus/TtdB family hydratase beta subunit [Candidatus Nitrobium versatile]